MTDADPNALLSRTAAGPGQGVEAPQAANLRRTPLYDRHVALGGQMVEFAGWEMPVQYAAQPGRPAGGLVAEHEATRTACGLFDVSHMGEIVVEGPDAEAEVNHLVSNDVRKLAPGEACYALFVHPHGGTVDDLYVYRLASDRFLLVVNASNVAKDFAFVQAHARNPATITNQSDDFAQIALQGRKAAEILQKVAPGEAIGLPRNRIRTHEFQGEDILVATTGYTGETGFEIYVRPGLAPALWDALLQAGTPLGLCPVGLGARDTLRLEYGYALYGHELDDHTNGYEARVGWAIKLDRPEGFVGRDALAQVKAEGPKRKLVGLKMLDRGIPRAGYPILHEGQSVGHVTSGTHSPTLKAPIALGYVPTALSKDGQVLEVELRGVPRKAEVVPYPFVKSNS